MPFLRAVPVFDEEAYEERLRREREQAEQDAFERAQEAERLAEEARLQEIANAEQDERPKATQRPADDCEGFLCPNRPRQRDTSTTGNLSSGGEFLVSVPSPCPPGQLPRTGCFTTVLWNDSGPLNTPAGYSAIGFG